jgi:hypothetical protein
MARKKQGLSTVADTDSESVEELVEEGQAIEAEAIADVEDAPGADSSEIHTRQSKLIPCPGGLIVPRTDSFYCLLRS